MNFLLPPLCIFVDLIIEKAADPPLSDRLLTSFADNLILKTNCGIEMPTKHFTQQAIIDHMIVLNLVHKTSP